MARALQSELQDAFPAPAGKLQSLETLAEIAEQVRAEGGSVVLAHGVFDL